MKVGTVNTHYRHLALTNSWITISRINPKDRSIFQKFKSTSLHELVNSNTRNGSTFFTRETWSYCKWIDTCTHANIVYAAIKTATMECLRFGLTSASWIKSSVMRATWPRQSVVPRPYSLSPCKQIRVIKSVIVSDANYTPQSFIHTSVTSLKGFLSQLAGLAGTTSRWEPTNAIVPTTSTAKLG